MKALTRAGALWCLGLSLAFLHAGADNVAAQYRAGFKKYDQQGRLVAAADERGQLWRFVHEADGSRRIWFDGREVGLERADGTVEAYAYDARGRKVQTRIKRQGAAPRYIDHVARRPASRTLPDAEARSYARDELGRLTRVTTSGGTTRYRYFEGVDVPLIAEVTRPDGSKERFELRTAWASYEALATPAKSARVAAAVASNTSGLCAASGNRFAFGGYRFDCELGLYFTPSGRMYDPQVGRFTSQDSYLGQIDNPPSLHRYTYAQANPLRFVDPTGHAVDPAGLVHAIQQGKGLSYVAGQLRDSAREAERALNAWTAEVDMGVSIAAANFLLAMDSPGDMPPEKAREYYLQPQTPTEKIASDIADIGFTAAPLLAKAVPGARGSANLRPGSRVGLDAELEATLAGPSKGAEAFIAVESKVRAGTELVPLNRPPPPPAPVGEQALGPRSGAGGIASGYEPLRPHPMDPNLPGGAANYRGRYNAALDADGRSRLPAHWDVHHSVPQQLRSDPRLQGFDIDAPSQMRGVPGYRQPGPQTNVHSLMDQEWRQFLRGTPNATRQELLDFRDYQDWRFQHTFWESQMRTKP